MTINFDKPEMVKTNGVTLPVYTGGPNHSVADKPAVFFLHGFPEIAYSWRAQMEALAGAGYPVFAPDQRGFGHSISPEGKDNYTMEKLTGDIVGLLDHYGIDKAVFVGHDWGAIVLWQLPFYAGDRLLGCAGLNVPLMRHFPVDQITLFRKHFGDSMYMVRFQEEGSCEPILERDLNATFRFFLRKPSFKEGKKPSLAFDVKGLDLMSLLEAGEDAWGGDILIGDEERARYIEAYKHSGFTKPVHWYRNMAANWEAQKRFLVDGALPKVELPCLMITADKDRACPASLADGMEDLCAPYERVDLTGCGHWSQQEKPDEVNAALLKWLSKHF